MTTELQKGLKLINKKLKTPSLKDDTVNDHEFISVVAHHDAEIRILGERMSGVETSLSGLNSKLDRLGNNINQVISRPQFSWTETLTVVKDFGLLIGFTVAAIIYVAGAQFNSELSLLKERQEKTTLINESRIDKLEKDNETVKNSRWSNEHHRNWCKMNQRVLPTLLCAE